MNKILTAGIGALALCGAVASAQAIESANICGYQQVTVPTGYYVFTPTFKNIGEEQQFDIKTIKPVLPSGVTVGQNSKVTVFVLDNEGNYGTSIKWFGKSSMWSKDGTHPIDDGEVMVGAGRGIAIQNTVQVNKDGSGVEVARNGNSTLIYLLVSGEVDLVCQNTVPAGYMLNGNSTPVAINLKSITPRLPSGVAVGQNSKVTVFMLNDEGNYETSIKWIGKSGIWSKDGSNEITDAEGALNAGQGFAVQNTVQVNKDGSGVEVARNGNPTPVYLELPSPIAE